MRKVTVFLVIALAAYLVTSDLDVPKHKRSLSRHRHNESSKFFSESDPRDESVSHAKDLSRKKHHHERKKKGRCRRYSQGYYDRYGKVQVFVPDYNNPNRVAPNYIPRDYIVPSYYSPRCASYCFPCVTSACRRRCPNYPGTTTRTSPKTTAKITVTTTALSSPTATVIVTVPRKSIC